MPATGNRARERSRPPVIFFVLFWAILGGLVISKLLVVSLFGGPAWARWIAFAALAVGYVWLELFDSYDDAFEPQSRGQSTTGAAGRRSAL